MKKSEVIGACELKTLKQIEENEAIQHMVEKVEIFEKDTSTLDDTTNLPCEKTMTELQTAKVLEARELQTTLGQQMNNQVDEKYSNSMLGESKSAHGNTLSSEEKCPVISNNSGREKNWDDMQGRDQPCDDNGSQYASLHTKKRKDNHSNALARGQNTFGLGSKPIPFSDDFTANTTAASVTLSFQPPSVSTEDLDGCFKDCCQVVKEVCPKKSGNGEIDFNTQQQHRPELPPEDDSIRAMNTKIVKREIPSTDSAKRGVFVPVSDMPDGRVEVSSSNSSVERDIALTAIVSNLPLFVSEKRLYNCFGRKCHGVKEAFLTKRGCGGIVLGSQEQVEICVKTMDKTIQFGRKIRVRAKIPDVENGEEKQGMNQHFMQRKHFSHQQQEHLDDEQHHHKQQKQRKKEQTQVQRQEPHQQLQQQHLQQEPHQQQQHKHLQQEPRQQQQNKHLQQEPHREKQNKHLQQEPHQEKQNKHLQQEPHQQQQNKHLQQEPHQQQQHKQHKQEQKKPQELNQREKRQQRQQQHQNQPSHYHQLKSKKQQKNLKNEQRIRKEETQEQQKRDQRSAQGEHDSSLSENIDDSCQKQRSVTLYESYCGDEFPVAKYDQQRQAVLTKDTSKNIGRELETVVISNIPKDITKGCLRQFIESKGCKDFLKLAKSKNLSVLTFSTTSQAKRALEVFDGLQWKENTLKAKKGFSKLVPDKNRVENEKNELLIVKLHNVPAFTNNVELGEFIMKQCNGVEISKLAKTEEGYTVKLESGEHSKIVHETLGGMTFHGKKIISTWTGHSGDTRDEEKPCIIASNLNPKFQEKAAKKIFEENCRGITSVGKKPNVTHGQVYFESRDLAERAGVRLGSRPSHKKHNNEFKCSQMKTIIAELEKRRSVLLNRNAEKVKELQSLLENLQSTRPKKLLFDVFERREEERKTYEQKQEELREQREEFESKYQQRINFLVAEAEDHKNSDYRHGIKKVIDQHRKAITRELKKFETSLPIYAKRSKVIEILRKNQALVLTGETGSGKSTQLPQYLADEFSQVGTVVVTQPRKIAAISLARRVACEYGCFVGQEVGYHVGIDRKVNGNTIIKFVTDRILLNEVLTDSKSMERYSCIVIDEAHERSIHTDLLLAVIKHNLLQHPNLRLIVTSATLNTEVFIRYFDNCPVVKVQGRGFPVERIYEDISSSHYTERVCEKTLEVCESGEEGDILIFLTQQNEIERTCEWLKYRMGDGNIILPLHGKLQADEQGKVFKPTPKGQRKIVVATNIAETSLTIDGIRIVIDSGMVKEPSFEPTRNMITLDIKMVSQSSAVQRSGRAGRTGPGKCYCMYTTEDFDEMEKDTKPEFLKSHLGMTVLQLLSLGVTNVEQFDFVEAPPPESLVEAKASLKLLGAIDENGTLTDTGKMMLELPSDPKLSKALLEGLKRGCGEDIIIVAGLMSSGHDVFYRGDTVEKKEACAIQKQAFCKTSGDLLSALEVYKLWSKEPKKKQSQWCMENALNSKRLRAVQEAINEIKAGLMKLGLGINPGSKQQVTSANLECDLCKSLLAGYSENIAWSRGHEKVGYTVVRSNQPAKIHPSSVLSSLGSQPKWILFQEIRRTSETFLLNVTPIEKDWLAEVATHMLQFVDEEEIRISQTVQERIEPVGSRIVKSIIGSRGSILRQIEEAVIQYASEYPMLTKGAPTDQCRVFCSLECDVEGGFVDVYSPASCVGYAKSKVMKLIEEKRRQLLEGCTEIMISNVGSQKVLVTNDMKTRLILQPEEFCKLNVFVEKKDKTAEVDRMEVLTMLRSVGGLVHHSFTATENLHCGKWGNVTYRSPRRAKMAIDLVESIFDATERANAPKLPNNVEKIKVKPCHAPCLQPSNPVSYTGILVLVTWFPFPSTGKAYIKCINSGIAVELLSKLNRRIRNKCSGESKACLNEMTGDIALHIGPEEDEFDVCWKIADCGFRDAEAITKITVPSRRENNDVQVEEEKKKVSELLDDFGQVHVLNLWIANCQKVIARVVFQNMEDAMLAIEELNGRYDCIGARAVHVEFENASEITCTKILYNKIEKTVRNTIEEHDIELQVENLGGREVKMMVTGNNAEVVQETGMKIRDLVAAVFVTIEDPAVVRGLSSGYGRDMLKKIEMRSDVIVQPSMMGRCIHITGSSEAKEQAFTLVNTLIKELLESKHVEISLKGPEIPVGTIREMLKEYGNDLKALVEGEECQVLLDVRKRKVILTGAENAVVNVREKIEAFLCKLCGSSRCINKDSPICPVCTDEVEKPYRLNLCGHCYCCVCINQYITSTFSCAKSADMFPRRCLHDGCEYPLMKNDFLAFLKADQIQQLYRISLESFLIGSSRYKPCPSPDCLSVYRSSTRPKVFSCPECRECVCRGCGNQPHKMYDTCEAYKASMDLSRADELYNKWVTEADTRKCPKCSVMIEKNEGCSHVCCTRCHAHICWKCGEYFLKGDQCYRHIEERHSLTYRRR